MKDRKGWNGQSPSLSQGLPCEMLLEDKGIQEKTHIMEGLSGYAHDLLLLDASLFSVFESTGDSEVDARPADRGTVAMEEDDAESCSCDDLASQRSEEGLLHQGEEGGGNAAAEDEEERDGAAEGGGGFGRHKSCVSAESKGGGVDLMNEMERNKLFWEACLAS